VSDIVVNVRYGTECSLECAPRTSMRIATNLAGSTQRVCSAFPKRRSVRASLLTEWFTVPKARPVPDLTTTTGPRICVGRPRISQIFSPFRIWDA
jgi:hypothetical protein